MKVSHFHVGVKDLGSAVKWFEAVGGIKPALQTEQMAMLPVGGMSLVIDRSEADIPVTIAFETVNCDAEYSSLVSRGAVGVTPPVDRPWGVRSAYLQGPGALTIELEQALSPSRSRAPVSD